ncbi:unnamed protein product [Arctogadus glacialis]
MQQRGFKEQLGGLRGGEGLCFSSTREPPLCPPKVHSGPTPEKRACRVTGSPSTLPLPVSIGSSLRTTWLRGSREPRPGWVHRNEQGGLFGGSLGTFKGLVCVLRQGVSQQEMEQKAVLQEKEEQENEEQEKEEKEKEEQEKEEQEKEEKEKEEKEEQEKEEKEKEEQENTEQENWEQEEVEQENTEQENVQ